MISLSSVRTRFARPYNFGPIKNGPVKKLRRFNEQVTRAHKLVDFWLRCVPQYGRKIPEIGQRHCVPQRSHGDWIELLDSQVLVEFAVEQLIQSERSDAP